MKGAQFLDVPTDQGRGNFTNPSGGGLYYKIGAHGKIFYWSGEEWIKSQKSKRELTRMFKIVN